MDNTDLRHHCYAMGYSDGEVGAFYDGYEKGRADAIDELVRMVARYYTAQERAGYYSDTNNMIKQRIADFGEQLKNSK